MFTSTLTLLATVLLTQAAGDRTKGSDSADSEVTKRRAAERLDFMKKSVSVYELAIADDSDETPRSPRQKAIVEAEPLLRWSDIHGDNDGTLFLWTLAGRPVAIAQVFSVEKGTRWLHEFQSLSVQLFSLNRDGRPLWTPGEAGLEFKPLADAPVPAKTAAQRLSQMHSLATRFAASDDYGDKGNVWQLRPLARPIYRYTSKAEGGEARATASGEELIDAAVFAYVVGTDPEMLLLLEARRDGSQSAWHYAIAPMTCFALKATLDGATVWTCPFRGAPYDRRNPFFSVDIQP